MKILKRHKNSGGITVGYTIQDNNTILYISSEALIANKHCIENANVLSNGEVKAHKGCHIETVVDTSSLVSIQQSRLNAKIANTGNSIDFYGKDYINICKRIRNYASAGKLIIDTSKHKSNRGLNTHLFKLIEECGLDVKTFITGYLSCLQPYNLKKFQGVKQSTITDQVWLCEFGYRVGIVIKLNEVNKERPIIVSFHESNQRGSFSASNVDLKSKPCAVIIDDIKGSGDDIYNVEFIVQKGFIRRKIQCATRYINKNAALINYRTIESEFTNVMQLIFDELSAIYGDNSTDSIDISLKGLNTFSILSYGYSALNNIIMLMDMYSKYTDNKSRMLISSLASEFISEVPKNQLESIKNALEDKYTNYNNNLYLAIKNSI